VELQEKYSIALSNLVRIVFGSTGRGAVYELSQVTRVNGWQPSSRLAPHYHWLTKLNSDPCWERSQIIRNDIDYTITAPFPCSCENAQWS